VGKITAYAEEKDSMEVNNNFKEFMKNIIFISLLFSICILSCQKKEIVKNNTSDKNGKYTAENSNNIGNRNEELSEISNTLNNLKTVMPINTESSIKNKTQERFVLINGGSFTMGSPSDEQGRANDEILQKSITINSFYMDIYEVTQADYEGLMGDNPSFFKGVNLPVEQVDWYNAIEYCNKKSLKEGLETAYIINKENVIWNRNAKGYRLPTEAEWEYACRAGSTTPFNTGIEINTNKANFNGYNPYSKILQEDRQKTLPVGSFAPNEWGLYDMHGNVFEWCWDWYGDYSGKPNQENPNGVSLSTKRVLRGGSWNSSIILIRSASRYSLPPFGSKESTVGFRLVRG